MELCCLLHQLHEDGECKCNEECAGYGISIRDAASDCLSKESLALPPFFSLQMSTYTRTHTHTQVCARSHTNGSENPQWKCDFTLLRQAKLKKLFHKPFLCWKLCPFWKTLWLLKGVTIVNAVVKWNHTVFVKVYYAVFFALTWMCPYVFAHTQLCRQTKTMTNNGNAYLSPSKQLQISCWITINVTQLHRGAPDCHII